MIRGLHKDLMPVGSLETLLVEKIALNYWRLRRLVRFETGEIRGGRDDFRENALSSHYEKAFYSRSRPALEYCSYNDEIADAEYEEQVYTVAAMESSGSNLEEEKAALDYVLRFRLGR